MNQVADSTNIGFLSSLREPSELKALDHSLSQFGHTYTSELICLVANRYGFKQKKKVVRKDAKNKATEIENAPDTTV